MKKIYTKLMIVTLVVIMLLCACKSVSEEKVDNKENNTTQQQKVEENSKKEQIENETSNEGKYFFDEQYLVDLNKDGKDDKVRCYKEEEKIKVEINGEVYELTDTDYEMVNKEYFIVDIDKNDYSVELVFKEAAPPYEEMLSFYRYGKGYLQNFGTTSITYEDIKNKMNFDGNGNIKIAIDSNIMQEGYYYKNFIISETGYLEAVMNEDYDIYINEITSNVNKKIKAYEERKIDSKNFEIMPDETIIIYGEKDNWLKIKWNDKELWINGEELEHFYADPDELFQFDGIKFWS